MQACSQGSQLPVYDTSTLCRHATGAVSDSNNQRQRSTRVKARTNRSFLPFATSSAGWGHVPVPRRHHRQRATIRMRRLRQESEASVNKPEILAANKLTEKNPHRYACSG